MVHFITLHGLPTAIQLAGIDLVTTQPAPITLPLPIVTPASMMHPPPTKHYLQRLLAKLLF